MSMKLLPKPVPGMLLFFGADLSTMLFFEIPTWLRFVPTSELDILAK